MCVIGNGAKFDALPRRGIRNQEDLRNEVWGERQALE